MIRVKSVNTAMPRVKIAEKFFKPKIIQPIQNKYLKNNSLSPHIKLRPSKPILNQNKPVVRNRQKTLFLRQRAIPANLRIQQKQIIRKYTPNTNDITQSIKGVGINKILLIIGNGPSHKEAPLTELLNIDNIDIMSINKPDDRLWPTKYWLFCDNSQQRRHNHLWIPYNGIVINSSAVKETKPGCVKIKSLHGKGFSTNLHNGMFIGRSSVYSAIQVGIWMGYTHIYVFGCDMTSVNGKVYPWGTNPDISDNNRVSRFKHEAIHYDWLVDNISEHIKNKITFCTRYNPYDFIKKFENLDHIEAVNIIKSRHIQVPSQITPTTANII